MNKILAVLAFAGLAVLAACNSAQVVKTPATAVPSSAATPSAAAPSSTSDTPSQPANGKPGDTFTVTDQDGNQYSVSVSKVIDPATGADEFTTPDSGKRFVAVVLTVKGISGHVTDSADNCSSLLGSNQQTYTTDVSSIKGYTDFNNGQFSVSPGRTLTGAMTFQLPDGVHPAEFTWTPNSGLSDTSASWDF